MINELIIVLSEKQQKELISRATKAGYDDDLEYLQKHIFDWLSDSNRLEHTEK